MPIYDSSKQWFCQDCGKVNNKKKKTLTDKFFPTLGIGMIGMSTGTAMAVNEQQIGYMAIAISFLYMFFALISYITGQSGETKHSEQVCENKQCPSHRR